MRYLAFFLLCLAPMLFGSMVLPTATVRPGQDYALFFAVDDYRAYPEFFDLSNPISSSKAIAAELRDMYAFQTEVVENPTKDRIYEVLQRYRDKAYGANDQLFVFFSGHGEFDEFEVKGFFIPQSGPRIDLSSLGNIIAKIPCKHTLLAIDACYSGTIDQKIAFMGRFNRPGATQDTERQNIIERKLRNQSRLLLTSGTKQRTPGGTDGSPFANGILQSLKAGYSGGDGLVTFEDLISRLERVSPLPYHGVLPGHDEGSFVFVANSVALPPRPTTNNSPTTILAPPDNMIFVRGGTFQMGDQFGDGSSHEKTVHTVTLSDFYLSRTELTNREFAVFLSSQGNQEQGGTEWYEIESSSAGIVGSGRNFSPKSGQDDHPVLEVSWYGAVAYCNWLSGQHGLNPVYRVSGTTVTPDWNANGYRLPTEAEWEYAARSGGKNEKYAGTSTESSLSQVANYAGKEDGYERTAPVGVLRANNLGLADMSGNVWEWCWDWYGSDYYGNSSGGNPRGPDTGTYRVVRGGSWYDIPSRCRAANRGGNESTDRSNGVGFRLARSF